jgi:hypothetical protein
MSDVGFFLPVSIAVFSGGSVSGLAGLALSAVAAASCLALGQPNLRRSIRGVSSMAVSSGISIDKTPQGRSEP